MKELKIGVIGAWGRGKLALNTHRPENGVYVTAAADINPKALALAKKSVGEDLITMENYRDLIARKDLDAVFITSPDFLHEEHAVAALEAGKAVYLEKPMAITIEGCDRILRTAYETGSRLYLGHNMRHFEIILKMKELIDAGQIGEVQCVWCRHFVGYGGDAYFKDWHSEKRYSTSLLLQKGAHDIDVIHWLAGGYTKSVVGMGKLSVYDKCERRSGDDPGDSTWNKSNWPPLSQKGISPIVDVEDHNMIMMQLDNGVQCCYMQCHYTPDNCRNYTFIGTEGRIENMLDHGDGQIYLYNDRKNSLFNDPNIIHKVRKNEGGHGGSDPAIVQEFFSFVRNGGKTNTSPIAARNSVAAGVMGAESIRNGSTPKEIPPVEDKLLEYFENGQSR